MLAATENEVRLPLNESPPKADESPRKADDSPVEYEDLLREAGGLGRYQWIILISHQAAVYAMAVCTFFMILGGYFPACFSKYLNITIDENTTEFLENITCRFEFHSLVADFTMEINGELYKISLITSVQMGAVLLGLLVGGQLAAFFGPRFVCIGALCLMSLAYTISGVSSSWEEFAIFQSVIGIFAGMCWAVVDLQIIEVLLPQHRSFLYLGWPAAHAYFAGIAYIAGSWRMLNYIGSASAVLPLVTFIFYAEKSPKWLIAKNRISDVAPVLTNIARKNGANIATVQYLSERYVAQEAAEKPTASRRFSYPDLFKNKKLALQTMALLFLVFSVNFIWYGLMFYLGDLSGNPYLNIVVISAIRIAMNIVWAVADKKFAWLGRRRVCQVSLSLLSLSIGTMTIMYIANRAILGTMGYTAVTLIAMLMISLLNVTISLYTMEVCVFLLSISYASFNNHACRRPRVKCEAKTKAECNSSYWAFDFEDKPPSKVILREDSPRDFEQKFFMLKVSHAQGQEYRKVNRNSCRPAPAVFYFRKKKYQNM